MPRSRRKPIERLSAAQARLGRTFTPTEEIVADQDKTSEGETVTT